MFSLDWTMIRRVFIRARQQFGLQAKNIDISKPDMEIIEVRIFSTIKIKNKTTVFYYYLIVNFV